MEGGGGLVVRGSLQLSLHVQGDAAADRRLGADSIHGLLPLAVTAVATLDGIGCGRQQRIVQERQGLLDVGREEFVECLTQGWELRHALSQAGQLGQSGFGVAAAVKEAVGLVYDLCRKVRSTGRPRVIR